MTKVTITLTVEINETITDITDNGITMTIENVIGKITGYHNVEVIDIDKDE